MMQKPGAIVIGGDYQGLGIIRSLGKNGIPVYLLDTGPCIGKVSKFTSKFFAYEETTLLEFLFNLAHKEKLNNWVIYPTTDEVVKLIAINKNELEKYYKIPTPKWEVTEILYNKKLTCKLAIDLGIPIPKTCFPESESIDKLELQFPVIIKPLSKGIFYKLTKKKALKARNRKELIKVVEAVRELPLPLSEIMIQEVIPQTKSATGGPSNLYSFCSLFKEGKALAKLSARRIRQHPMDFGRASTFVETVDIPELEMLGTKLLSKLDYYGLSEVEFMWDPRDKTYKLLEVNARTWGWHTFGSGIGLDFPFLLYKDLMGENLAQYIVPLQKDVKWIRILTDTGLVAYEILKGRMKVCEYIASLKGKKEYAVWSYQDPLPFLFEIFLLPWLFKTRGF
ncbi:ATP-grasp domain-containing protein [candidate division WOR-3 bacterium]|nr:ATP-grasp domain-containing protein [candidate division WOR-3 bacterium]